MAICLSGLFRILSSINLQIARGSGWMGESSGASCNEQDRSFVGLQASPNGTAALHGWIHPDVFDRKNKSGKFPVHPFESPKVNIIIVGAGEVGRHLAEGLSTQLHNITVIEASEEKSEDLDEGLDATVLCGNGAAATTLAEANVGECDLFLALTSMDNTNLVSASLAHSMGAKKTVSRVHASVQREEWLFDYRSHFGIDYLFSTERLAAVELAKFVRNPEGLMVEDIARGRIELHQYMVSPESGALGVPLSKLGLPERVRVACIMRDGVNSIPGGEDHLMAGDLVTLFGEPTLLDQVISLLDPRASRKKDLKVVIYGGGEYAFALAQMLEGASVHVRVMEKRESECRRLSAMLQDSLIINGDATSLQQLREEQVDEADFFIAVSPDDEDNVMACLQAKSLGTEYCLTLIHRADYADVIYRNRQRLGLLAAVSPRLATNRDLLRFMEAGKYHKFSELQGGVEVIQLSLREGSKILNHKISEIEWPRGAALVGLLRDQMAIVPTGDDALFAEDTVYAIVTAEARKPLVKILTR
ncbi:MAG: Trk system potassium transporter TrkA [Verrucomicrobiota bacterium]|nr:Trk system potassium transporter TrkA [Verrucomicrobiota bacterium]